MDALVFLLIHINIVIIVFVFNSFPRRISFIYFYEAYDIVVYLIFIFIFNKKQRVKHIEKLIISFWENTPEKNIN